MKVTLYDLCLQLVEEVSGYLNAYRQHSRFPENFFMAVETLRFAFKNLDCSCADFVIDIVVVDHIPDFTITPYYKGTKIVFIDKELKMFKVDISVVDQFVDLVCMGLDAQEYAEDSLWTFRLKSQEST